jgi:hypothetical protein
MFGCDHCHERGANLLASRDFDVTGANEGSRNRVQIGRTLLLSVYEDSDSIGYPKY